MTHSFDSVSQGTQISLLDSIYILRHILTVAKLEKKKRFTAFLDLIAAYDSV